MADARRLDPESIDPAARAVVLVEGDSDRNAVEALAIRHGRDLAAEGIVVTSMGGATNIARFLGALGSNGRELPVAGLYDIAEERVFRRGLERTGHGGDDGERLDRAAIERLGFFACDVDLEDELIRALGVPAIEAIMESEGELASFRTFQKQPAQLVRSDVQQVRRFLGTRSGRKIRYGSLLVDALDLSRTPRPLELLLEHVTGQG